MAEDKRRTERSTNFAGTRHDRRGELDSPDSSRADVADLEKYRSARRIFPGSSPPFTVREEHQVCDAFSAARIVGKFDRCLTTYQNAKTPVMRTSTRVSCSTTWAASGVGRLSIIGRNL